MMICNIFNIYMLIILLFILLGWVLHCGFVEVIVSYWFGLWWKYSKHSFFLFLNFPNYYLIVLPLQTSNFHIIFLFLFSFSYQMHDFFVCFIFFQFFIFSRKKITCHGEGNYGNTHGHNDIDDDPSQSMGDKSRSWSLFICKGSEIW